MDFCLKKAVIYNNLNDFPNINLPVIKFKFEF